MLPVIGLTHSINPEETTLHAPLAYPRAVARVGGMPLIIPASENETLLAACLDRIDGLLLTGGDDLDPAVYGEKQLWQCGDVNPLRDAYEIRLCRMALQRHMPVLAICRGIQLLNAAMGGTLYQDLPSQLPASIAHRQKQKPFYPSHAICIREDSLLHRIFGRSEILVNSHHHQAVKDAAPGLVISATAPDGVIEAVESPSLPFCLGVQWHPEQLVLREQNETQMKLFTAFIDACRKENP